MFYHPTGSRPKRVALVGLGPSRAAWCEAMTAHEPAPFDEVWTFNTGIRWLEHDLAFVMDDLRQFAGSFPEYGKLLASNDAPIITSRVYPEYPAAVAYPLAQVINRIGLVNAQFSHNSTPYVLAYAYLIGVVELALFGVDYQYAGTTTDEAGRAACEYMVGFVRARGMDVKISGASSLCDMNRRGTVTYRGFYGYAFQPVVKRFNDGHYSVYLGDRPAGES